MTTKEMRMWAEASITRAEHLAGERETHTVLVAPAPDVQGLYAMTAAVYSASAALCERLEVQNALLERIAAAVERKVR